MAFFPAALRGAVLRAAVFFAAVLRPAAFFAEGVRRADVFAAALRAPDAAPDRLALFTAAWRAVA